MIYNIDSIDTLKNDIGNKTLAFGYRLAGDVSGEKVKLYLEDAHGKHSKFAAQVFYGKLNGNTLDGSFRISNYALVWMIVLAVLAVENMVTALVFQATSGIAVSLAIIIVEIIYFFALKKFSAEHDEVLDGYLKSLNGGE